MTQEEHNNNCQHTWHRKFGHRDPEIIKDLENKDLASGIKIKDCGIRKQCDCCIKGKMTRKPFPKQSYSSTNAILDLIHTDVCGPIQITTPANKRYILTLIDDYSRYTKICLMQYKSEVAGLIKEFIVFCKTQHQKVPKVIRSDRGREYVNNELRQYLKSEGIQIQYTVTYSPQQNGVARKKNRSLLEMTRCMLIDSELHDKYWGEAVNTANYLQNRLPTRCRDITPYELWYSRKPDIKHLQIFGCTAYVHIPKEQRRS
jgi:Integrase core domain.